MVEDFKTKYVVCPVAGLPGGAKLEIKTYFEGSENGKNHKNWQYFACFNN